MTLIGNIITLLIIPIVVTILIKRPQLISELTQVWGTSVSILTGFLTLRIILLIIEIFLKYFKGGDNIAAVSNSFQGILLAILVSIIKFIYCSQIIVNNQPIIHQKVKEGYLQERIIILAIYSIFIYYHTFIVTRFNANSVGSIGKENSNLLLIILITFMVGFAIVAVIVASIKNQVILIRNYLSTE